MAAARRFLARTVSDGDVGEGDRPDDDVPARLLDLVAVLGERYTDATHVRQIGGDDPVLWPDYQGEGSPA